MNSMSTPLRLALVALLGLTLVAGCGGGEENSAAADAGGAPAGTAFGSTEGSVAPDFTLPRLAGGELSLSQFRGKAVIVDFWDTWCPPCRRALPHLQELSQTYAGDLVVIGVAFGQEGEQKVRSYTAENGLTFEMVLFQESSSILQDFGGIQSIPTTFLIDRDGVIRKKWVGAADKDAYEAAIVAAIGS